MGYKRKRFCILLILGYPEILFVALDRLEPKAMANAVNLYSSSVPGIKKEDLFGLLFGARNRTSSIIRYYSLLADIVCINPFRNKPDMTIMTNNSSKI